MHRKYDYRWKGTSDVSRSAELIFQATQKGFNLVDFSSSVNARPPARESIVIIKYITIY